MRSKGPLTRLVAKMAGPAWVWLLLMALSLAGCGGGGGPVSEGLVNPPRLSVVCLQVEDRRPEPVAAGKPTRHDIAQEASYQLREAGLLVLGPGLSPASTAAGVSSPLGADLASGCPARLHIALHGRVRPSRAWSSSVDLKAWAYMMMTLEIRGEPLLLLRYNGPQVQLRRFAPNLGTAERRELTRRLAQQALARAAGKLDYATALARFLWRMHKLGLSPM